MVFVTLPQPLNTENFCNASSLLKANCGRLAQLARALARQARGHWFESSIAHIISQGLTIIGRFVRSENCQVFVKLSSFNTLSKIFTVFLLCLGARYAFLSVIFNDLLTSFSLHIKNL